MKVKPKASLTAIGTAGKKAGKKAVELRPSTNGMTNLIIADLVIRAGTRALRHGVERAALGTKYSPAKAKEIVKSRTMVQTLVGTAVARVATTSVPGALVVGGALLAKSLYDRRKDNGIAKAEGKIAIEDQVEQA